MAKYLMSRLISLVTIISYFNYVTNTFIFVPFQSSIISLMFVIITIDFIYSCNYQGIYSKFEKWKIQIR